MELALKVLVSNLFPLALIALAALIWHDDHAQGWAVFGLVFLATCCAVKITTKA